MLLIGGARGHRRFLGIPPPFLELFTGPTGQSRHRHTDCFDNSWRDTFWEPWTRRSVTSDMQRLRKTFTYLLKRTKIYAFSNVREHGTNRLINWQKLCKIRLRISLCVCTHVCEVAWAYRHVPLMLRYGWPMQNSCDPVSGNDYVHILAAQLSCTIQQLWTVLLAYLYTMPHACINGSPPVSMAP